MADNKIGGLPVVEGDRLVGIITETDIFKILVELLGARTPGLRITVRGAGGQGRAGEADARRSPSWAQTSSAW